MNNEFDNNQQAENTGNNSYSDYTDRNQTNNIDMSSAGNANSTDMGYNAVNSSDIAVNEGKPKKKRTVAGLFKLTAAALVFGLVSGAAFQGYYMLSNPPASADENTSGNNLEATQTSNNKDTIIPATTAAEGVAADVSDVVEKVMPSIVAINSTANVTNYDLFGREYTQQVPASGSGIIIGQNNSKLLIVTNNHVIDGAKTVEIVFSDNTKASAEVKGADANTDLAVLSVDMTDISEETASAIKVASLGSSEDVQPGDMAIAIGNALGYGQSVTVGYISAVNREVTVGDLKETLLQTDAAINPGNSGGALLNAKGQVIGINSVKYSDTAVEGMGYAIPISSALPMINELIDRQLVSAKDQGYLGIDASHAQDVTDVYSQRFNMPIGVYINNVIAGSPAEAAGLKQGDIITGLDNNKIETMKDLINVLSYKKAGQKISLTIQEKENGSYVEKTLEITLGNKN